MVIVIQNLKFLPLGFHLAQDLLLLLALLDKIRLILEPFRTQISISMRRHDPLLVILDQQLALMDPIQYALIELAQHLLLLCSEFVGGRFFRQC